MFPVPNHQVTRLSQKATQQKLANHIRKITYIHHLSDDKKTFIFQADKSSKESFPHDKQVNRCIKVLIVEDNPILQKIHTNFLKSLHCQVTVAKTGVDAVRKSLEKYDLIFMDINLPDFNGIYTTQLIRLSNNPNVNTPIIALTSEEKSKQLEESCFEAGMNDFASKPTTIPIIKKIIDKWY